MESSSNLLGNQERTTDECAPLRGKLQGCNQLEDRISHLPDEILVSVLSRLDIEQQARTSILARRWAKLWRYSTNLRFVFMDNEDYLLRGKLFYATKFREFVTRVNNILELHLGSGLEEFTAKLFLNDKTFQHDIDGWLKLALQKRVQRLKFVFLIFGEISNNYSLTAEVICNHKVDSLTSVHLHFIDVAGDVLEYLLSASPFLEELSVSESQTLVNFTVTGQFLKLKHLEIKWCSELEHLHIYDVNLVSLTYFGCPRCVTIKDTPCLVKAELSQLLVKNHTNNDVQLLSHLPLLETLTVLPGSVQEITYFPKFPILRHLKHLELGLQPCGFCTRLCANLLEASPLLSELKVEFHYCCDFGEEETVQRLENQHRGLKVVELIGFTGCWLELNVAAYIIENAAALEKMIIDTHITTPDYEIDPNEQEAARTIAREQLLVRLPPGVQQIVI